MHTHFTRLPHQWVAKKVPPPPLLGRWLLMLGVLLMTWGLVPRQGALAKTCVKHRCLLT